MDRPRQNPLAAAALAALLAAVPVAAQSPPRYHPAQLDCASYHESRSATVRLTAGNELTRETSGRDGLLRLRASAASGDSMITLEAWFDTLSVWREGAGLRIAPETDGLIGGRYRGRLGRTGGFAATELPFVPDEVAQVAGLRGALDDLLPTLPPVPLAPGAGWRDDLGTVIQRMPDVTLAGRRSERYRLVRTGTRQRTELLPDSTAIEAREESSEIGTWTWDPGLGVVRWERDVQVELAVPPGGAVPRGFRTRIEQRVVLERVATTTCGE